MKISKHKELGIATRCIVVGNDVCNELGNTKLPLYMNSTYRLEDNSTFFNTGEDFPFGYVRDRNINQYALESKLLAIEEGTTDEMDALVTASGVSAINTTLFSLLSQGDHIICSNPCYTSVHRFVENHLGKRYGVEYTFVNASDPAQVRAAIRENTKVIHIETPGNPITRITDIASVAAIAKEHGIALTVDSTWGTPLLQSPLLLGADYVFHSLTKYINGHGDAMGGVVIGPREMINYIRNEGEVRLGPAISPFNAWMIMRGMTTLPLRMKRHCENALELAKRLEAHPGVDFVRYPGLESHPEYLLAKKQMSGFGGMLIFGLKCDDDKHLKMVENLKIIIPGVSLGHEDTLIVFRRMTPADPGYDILTKTEGGVQQSFFRVSVGLEDVEDLYNDIATAMEAAGV